MESISRLAKIRLSWVSLKLTPVFLTCFFIFPFSVHGADSCAEVFSTKAIITSRHNVWEKLRMSDMLVNQKSIPGKTGLCATACAINLAQAVAVESGRTPINQIQQVFESFVREHSLEGGASLTETVGQLEALFRELFEGKLPSISAVIIPGVEESREVVKIVDTIALSDFQLGTGEVKMLMTAQLAQDGGFLFQHAQVLESIKGNEIRVIEPNAPNIEIVANSVGTFSVNNIQLPRFFYRDDLGIIHSFVVFGMITVKK